MAQDKTPEENVEAKRQAEAEQITAEEAQDIDPVGAETADVEPEENEDAKLDKAEVGAEGTTSVKKAGPKARRAKEETGASDEDEGDEDRPKRKQPQNPTRTRLERRGKKYRKAVDGVDLKTEYPLTDAIKQLNDISFVNFDPSVELHANLGVDPKQSDQNVRSSTTLPHGTGKTRRIAVLGNESVQKAAKAAGADITGEQDLLDKIEKNDFEFEILVTTPDMMSKLGRYAKVLGPKGLMPSPKSGTITSDPAKVVKELKGGRIEFRVDKYGIIHQIVGKLSFKPAQLEENILTLMRAIQAAKPSSTKNIYLQKVSLTTSMGPSLKLNVAELQKAL